MGGLVTPLIPAEFAVVFDRVMISILATLSLREVFARLFLRLGFSLRLELVLSFVLAPVAGAGAVRVLPPQTGQEVEPKTLDCSCVASGP